MSFFNLKKKSFLLIFLFFLLLSIILAIIGRIKVSKQKNCIPFTFNNQPFCQFVSFKEYQNPFENFKLDSYRLFGKYQKHKIKNSKLYVYLTIFTPSGSINEKFYLPLEKGKIYISQKYSTSLSLWSDVEHFQINQSDFKNHLRKNDLVIVNLDQPIIQEKDYKELDLYQDFPLLFECGQTNYKLAQFIKNPSIKNKFSYYANKIKTGCQPRIETFYYIRP